MKIARAQPNGLGQFCERQQFVAPLNQPAGLRDQDGVFGIPRRGVGMATLAGSKACRPGRFQRVVQNGVGRVWPARRAGRATVDARGRHRIPEFSIRRPVAREDALPARIVDRRDIAFEMRRRHGSLSRCRRRDIARSALAPHSGSCFQIRICKLGLGYKLCVDPRLTRGQIRLLARFEVRGCPGWRERAPKSL